MKRMLRVNHPMLQLQVLKLIKSQMPWCGRKWRQSKLVSVYGRRQAEAADIDSQHESHYGHISELPT